MPMIRYLFILFICFLTCSAVVNAEYLISGQNTVQKIFYTTSSDFSKTHTGKKAMDSDPQTVWLSEKTGADHWIEIDFGIKRLMSTIIVRTGKKDNRRTVKNFVLQFHHMGKWFDFAKVNCENSKGGYSDVSTIDLGGIDASKFRILVPSDATYDGYCAIAEIEAYVGAGRIKYYDERLRTLIYPVHNGFLPESKESFPNAPRAYRGGRHAGLDIFFYHDDDSYTPISVTKKTPILAAGSGKVIRVDRSYVSLSPSEWKALSAYYQKNPHTFDARSFGGRQVWIDHLNGIVTTYNHLSSIDPSIEVGKSVTQGQTIGTAGNSGLLGDAEGKDWGTHLHFEIWVDAYYLGSGMSYDEVLNYVRWIFFPQQ